MKFTRNILKPWIHFHPLINLLSTTSCNFFLICFFCRKKRSTLESWTWSLYRYLMTTQTLLPPNTLKLSQKCIHKYKLCIFFSIEVQLDAKKKSFVYKEINMIELLCCLTYGLDIFISWTDVQKFWIYITLGY